MYSAIDGGGFIHILAAVWIAIPLSISEYIIGEEFRCSSRRSEQIALWSI
jgi:hypothetical protein